MPVQNIYTSGYAASRYVKENVVKEGEKVFVVSEQGLKEELMKVGV